MARKEISTPLDLKNMDNHNYNYDELYGLIDETDRRISEDMWEEIKDANTMKMLKPVQTAADLPHLADLLPSEEADKSLVTVIDEQRVYGFVKGEWQPFNQIDLDPFEPFKDELSEIVAAYEKQIQNITQEVQSTKDSAIESLESTQSQAESNINQTEQSAVSSINQTQTDVESQISTIRAEMTTQASDLTALFNDHMAQLTSKQDTALSEVESAKQAAITALEDFNNTDTSNWQKYKLTQDDGGAKGLTKVDWADTAQLDALEVGQYYATSTINPPVGASSYNAFITVIKRAGEGFKRIEYKPFNSSQVFIKRFYQEWSEWEPLSGTEVDLYKGDVSGVGSTFTLNDDPEKYSHLIVDIHHEGGQHAVVTRVLTGSFLIRDFNLANSGNGAVLIECYCNVDSTDPTQIELANSVKVDTDTASGGENNDLSILKVVGVAK